MAGNFILSCESTVDMPYSYISGRDIPVLFYTYVINGEECIDDMGRDPEALPEFYRKLKEGGLPKTSAVNYAKYLEYFDELLKKGDVLHVTLGSGMTSSVANAEKAAEELRPKYPDRKITVVDSLGSSTGYGMLVDDAADLRDEGKSMEKVTEWLLANRNRIHHQFLSTDLQYYRRGGRISGAAATVGAILNICPMMRINSDGKIIAYTKVRGKKNAIKETIATMKRLCDDHENYSGKCFVNHSNCLADAELTVSMLHEQFPNIKGEIKICDIGTIIASHTGPGTISVFFHGEERVK